MKIALIGLMQSGKSSIFHALSGKPMPVVLAAVIEEAIVLVPDPRFDWLVKLYNPKKITHATIDCLDVPGFNFTDEHGRAAARRLIYKLRTEEMLVLVIRAFESSTVAAYRNRVDPARDLEEIMTELLLADLEVVATRIENIEKELKKPSKPHGHEKAELEFYKRLQDAIESGRPIASAIHTETEKAIVKSLGFLTLKPIVVAVNVGEDRIDEQFDFARIVGPGVAVISICAKLQQELAQLDPDSRTAFMADLGIKELASDELVRSCYAALGLISFFTVAHTEVHAWPIEKGTTALDAAGKVHSDIKRGFIRAETMTFDDLKAHGSEKAVKAAGKVRLEGKETVVNDGDIIYFRFNV